MMIFWEVRDLEAGDEMFRARDPGPDDQSMSSLKQTGEEVERQEQWTG
jgi:hypothetical protein